MNLTVSYAVVFWLLVIDDNCSAELTDDNKVIETREKDTEKEAKVKFQPLKTDFKNAISNAQEVNHDNNKGNYSLNIKRGGEGGGEGISPAGDGGSIRTNFVIKKIRTIHTSEGSKTLIKTDDGRKLTSLNLVIDGGGGGGGGGVGKGGDGGGVITNLLIRKIQSEHRKGSKVTTSGSESPLHGVSLNIKGGGGGGGGGPGPGGKGGNLVTNVVIGKLQQRDSRNGSVERANQKKKQIVKDARNGTVERVDHKEKKIVKNARKKLMKAMKNQKKKRKRIEKEGKKTREK